MNELGLYTELTDLYAHLVLNDSLVLFIRVNQIQRNYYGCGLKPWAGMAYCLV